MPAHQAPSGYFRRRYGSDTGYIDARGRRMKSPAVLSRIRRLAIPPAYRQVWVCADRNAALQATAIDACGRRQYRYLERWQRQNAARKFRRMAALGRVLPRLRRRLARDLRRPRPDRAWALAVAVALIDATGVRVGAERYLRDNRSFGLTNLRDAHLQADGPRSMLCFKGRSGQRCRLRLQSPQLIAALRRSRALPGSRLLQYLDAQGHPHPLSPAAINGYLRSSCGIAITAKDLRTWRASTRLLEASGNSPRSLHAALAQVAAELGHSTRTCRQHDIDPRVIAALEGRRALPSPRKRRAGLRRAEQIYLELREDAATMPAQRCVTASRKNATCAPSLASPSSSRM